MKENKPPIGIMPEIMWKGQRLSDIDEAIKRYQEAGLPISTAWIFERNNLLYDINHPYKLIFTKD